MPKFGMGYSSGDRSKVRRLRPTQLRAAVVYVRFPIQDNLENLSVGIVHGQFDVLAVLGIMCRCLNIDDVRATSIVAAVRRLQL